MQRTENGRFVFELVQEFAEKAAEMKGDVGLVVGLTNASDGVRGRVADLPLLMPGLGAQGGDLAALADDQRKAPIVVNVSRGVLYGEFSHADAARDFKERIEAVLG